MLGQNRVLEDPCSYVLLSFINLIQLNIEWFTLGHLNRGATNGITKLFWHPAQAHRGMPNGWVKNAHVHPIGKYVHRIAAMRLCLLAWFLFLLFGDDFITMQLCIMWQFDQNKMVYVGINVDNRVSIYVYRGKCTHR